MQARILFKTNRRLNPFLRTLHAQTPKRLKIQRTPIKRKRRAICFVKAPLQQRIDQTSAFVDAFRQASPYIVEHADRLFVIVIPGEVVAQENLFYKILEDLQLLHSLGVYLVVVIGSQKLLDSYLEDLKLECNFYNGIRVTTSNVLDGAIHVASIVRRKIEGFFSKTPSVPLMRRHGMKGSSNMTAKIINGNFIAAKPLGIISGINFLSTGNVRFISHEPIQEQLRSRNIVLLDNLGYSANGEILNCNAYEIGLHAAVQLKADKLICLHLNDPAIDGLPNWIPLDTALDQIPPETKAVITEKNFHTSTDNSANHQRSSVSDKLTWSFELLSRALMPSALNLCILSCFYGVHRAHLINAEMDGALLSELYTRDGVGQMISTDLHEGIRPAMSGDVVEIEQLLRPLAENGITIQRSYQELLSEVQNFRVFEKERRILGCALIKRWTKAAAARDLVELAALCIHPDIRCQGKGDALLTYIEKELMEQNVEVLFLLTTRTASWFVQRGFQSAGPAHESAFLPTNRLKMIDSQRNSQLYLKRLRVV